MSVHEEYCKKAFFFATQARDQAPHYQHSEIGYNYRMSNICAGIGRGQMLVLNERIRQRRENWFYYQNALTEFKGIRFQSEPDDRFFSNHWLTTILVNPAECNGITREDIRLCLEDHNIESRPLWKPMHLQPVFHGFPSYTNGTSECIFEIGLCLPSSSCLTNENLNQVSSVIADLIIKGK